MNKKKRGSQSDQDTKIAALELALQEQKQIIASMSSQKEEAPLPPKASKDPLKPPSGFTQRDQQ